MKLRFFLIFLCILLFAGCATTPTKADIEQSLRERAEAYWKLRMADKYEETYEMEYKEGLPPFAEYLDKVRAMKKIHIVGHSIKSIKTDGQNGTVEVEIRFILPITTKPFKQTLPDLWVYERGKWRHQLPKN